MGSIEYKIGDAVRPDVEGMKIIAHICNDIGAWGRGFVMAISDRWIKPKKKYQAWIKSGAALGDVQIVPVEEDIVVANMIGQRGIRKKDGIPPIRYDAVRICLKTLAYHALQMNASVHMPRIGSGLAGGSWGKIESIIQDELIAKGISVTVYDLKED